MGAPSHGRFPPAAPRSFPTWDHPLLSSPVAPGSPSFPGNPRPELRSPPRRQRCLRDRPPAQVPAELWAALRGRPYPPGRQPVPEGRAGCRPGAAQLAGRPGQRAGSGRRRRECRGKGRVESVFTRRPGPASASPVSPGLPGVLGHPRGSGAALRASAVALSAGSPPAAERRAPAPLTSLGGSPCLRSGHTPPPRTRAASSGRPAPRPRPPPASRPARAAPPAPLKAPAPLKESGPARAPTVLTAPAPSGSMTFLSGARSPQGACSSQRLCFPPGRPFPSRCLFPSTLPAPPRRLLPAGTFPGLPLPIQSPVSSASPAPPGRPLA